MIALLPHSHPAVCERWAALAPVLLAPAGELPAASPRVASTSLVQGEDRVAPQADARSRADPEDVRSLVAASLAQAHAFLASPTLAAEVPML